MLTIGLARIGNEPVVKFTSENKPLMELSLAYDYGRKNADGKYPTQWVTATLFGDRAEKLAPYLQKGNQIMVQLEDLHIENYIKKDGVAGSSLKARIANLQFTSQRKEESREQPKPAKTENNFSDLNDDIPF